MGPELVIAGWFASPVVRDLINHISKLPVWLKKKDELMKLETALQRIQAVVETVEDLQIIDNMKPGLKAWLWQLKDAMEEASNVLDELEYYRLEERVKSGGEKVIFGGHNPMKQLTCVHLFRAFFYQRHGLHIEAIVKLKPPVVPDVYLLHV